MTRLFLTGATGYIGGSILAAAEKAHPDWSVTVLVRDAAKAAAVQAAYSSVRTVMGDNTSAEVLAREAGNATVVIHTASSDEDRVGTPALLRGVKSSGAAYIHTSGGLAWAGSSLAREVYGEAVAQEAYDDWSGAERIFARSEDLPHSFVDHLVISAAQAGVSRAAIVYPGMVYGLGEGPCKKHTFPLWQAMLQRRQPFVIGAGTNRWGVVHVQDLAKLYLSLGEALMRPDPEPAVCLPQGGVFMGQSASIVLGEYVTRAATVGFDLGVFDCPEIEHVDVREADRRQMYIRFVLGTDSFSRAQRAACTLGWTPTCPSIEDDLPRWLTACE